MGFDPKTQLVLDALNIALTRRQPTGVIHHSDQGSTYASVAFGLRCNQPPVLSSSPLARRRFGTTAEAKTAVLQSIVGGTIPAGAIPRSATCRPLIPNAPPRSSFAPSARS